MVRERIFATQEVALNWLNCSDGLSVLPLERRSNAIELLFRLFGMRLVAKITPNTPNRLIHMDTIVTKIIVQISARARRAFGENMMRIRVQRKTIVKGMEMEEADREIRLKNE